MELFQAYMALKVESYKTFEVDNLCFKLTATTIYQKHARAISAIYLDVGDHRIKIQMKKPLELQENKIDTLLNIFIRLFEKNN